MENPSDRLTAFGTQLIEVHDWLREELAQLRENVDSYLDGRGGRPRELRVHCLTFCSALNLHHTGEDSGAFPVLAEQFPELRPVLRKLEQDHSMVAWILANIEALVGGLDEAVDAGKVRAELDGLSAIMESHFVYEEKQIVAALNALTAPDWTPDFLVAGAD